MNDEHKPQELTVLEGGAAKPHAVLRSVEIVGLKSFMHKTRLEFAPGITAIVGPNGSGKTNVAEGIRWVLGEGSNKALRVKRSEELIFSGSETKRALGMAEVVLHLDNSTRRLPIDFSEVEIARRFYRSGEGETFINRAKVRLRDLEDLLAGANLADNPFVVIGQGLVDQVLALRPQERRVVIEEAAGTRRLALRREEALAKLQAAEVELVRVNDVLREIGPRRALLEEQAARWRQYEAVRGELRKRALGWYRGSYAEAGRARDELRVRLARVDGELAALAAEIAGAETAALLDAEGVARARDEDEKARLALEAALADEARSREELAGLRASLAALHEQRDRLKEALAQLPAELASLRGRLRGADAEAAASGEVAQGATAQLAAAERDWKAREARAADASAARVAAERESVAREGAVLAAVAESRSLERHLADLDARERELTRERVAAEREREKVASRLARARSALDEISRRVEAVATETGALRADRARVDADLTIVRGQAAALEDALARAHEEIELRRRALAGEAPVLPDGLWWLFERVRVPADLERSVRAALGGRVVIADALARASVVREAGVRGVTVLQASAAFSQKAPGIPLADVLEPLDAAARAVARAALAGIFLVEHEAAALAAAATLAPGVQLVTRDGVVVSRGRVTIAADAADDLAARRRLGVVEEIAARLTREAEAARRSIADLEGQRERGARSLAEREASLRAVQQERVARERETAELVGEESRLHDAVRAVDVRVTALEREREDLRARREAVAGQHAAATQARAAAAEALARAEDAERGAVEALRAAEATLAGGRVEAAMAEERRASLGRLRETLSEQAFAAERRLAVEQERLAALDAHERELAERVAHADAQAQRLAARATEARRRWDAARATALAAEGQRRESEERRARARERMAELRGDRGRFAAEEERADGALRLLDEQVRAELGLSDEDPLPDPSSIELGHEAEERGSRDALRELQRLRRKLIALEPVNPLAASELAEVAERHDFLASQKDDLERAIADLRMLAGDLARTIAEQFSATLQAVDREFANFFARLFNGGTASLRVVTADEEPGKPGEAGIDILARPPGKRLSSLAQLSGGERALTATALLLAILRVRPAPFCVLDEVDAALDERNIGRFIQALRELTDRTQFVVITHNRGTIEAADALYGVSMDASGVSKVVSLRLADLDKEKTG